MANLTQDQVYSMARQSAIDKGLVGRVPTDGANYGITTGSADQWASFMTRTAKLESGYNPNNVYEEWAFRGGSRGLYQLSYDDAKSYGLNGGVPFSSTQLADPQFNTDTAASIMGSRLDVNNSISSRSGLGAYWSTARSPSSYSDLASNPANGTITPDQTSGGAFNNPATAGDYTGLGGNDIAGAGTVDSTGWSNSADWTSTDTSYGNIKTTDQQAIKQFQSASQQSTSAFMSMTIPQAIDNLSRTEASNTAKENQATAGLAKSITSATQLASQTAKDLTDKMNSSSKNLFSRGTIIVLGIVFVAGGIWLLGGPSEVRKALK